MKAADAAAELGAGRRLMVRLRPPEGPNDPAVHWEVRVLQLRQVLTLVRGDDLDVLLAEVLPDTYAPAGGRGAVGDPEGV